MRWGASGVHTRAFDELCGSSVPYGICVDKVMHITSKPTYAKADTTGKVFEAFLFHRILSETGVYNSTAGSHTDPSEND